jgi:hypothetical protein
MAVLKVELDIVAASSDTEHRRRKVDTSPFNSAHEFWPQACWLYLPDHLSSFKAGLLEDIQVRQDDRVILNALDLCNPDDFARAIGQLIDLADEINRRGDKLLDNAFRQPHLRYLS